MLLKIRQLVIENQGHKRNIVPKNIYINSDNIVSITDYRGADHFLLSEKSKFSKERFSLLKVTHGNKIEDIIAFGTAESIYSEATEHRNGRSILND
jgi:hypothetical protein|tara:strand:- start:7048 stop:7335 length:288 start_codon:yes stop_codon:yes gene_type:complete